MTKKETPHRCHPDEGGTLLLNYGPLFQYFSQKLRVTSLGGDDQKEVNN
jgi:hypothetical protein